MRGCDHEYEGQPGCVCPTDTPDLTTKALIEQARTIEARIPLTTHGNLLRALADRLEAAESEAERWKGIRDMVLQNKDMIAGGSFTSLGEVADREQRKHYEARIRDLEASSYERLCGHCLKASGEAK